MSLIYVQLVAFDWIFIFPMYVCRLLSSRHHLMISTFTVTARSTWCVWTVSKSFNADLADTCAPIHYYALSAWLNWLQSNLDLLQAEPSNWSHRIKYLTGLMTPRVSGFWQLFSTKRFVKQIIDTKQLRSHPWSEAWRELWSRLIRDIHHKGLIIYVLHATID